MLKQLLKNVIEDKTPCLNSDVAIFFLLVKILTGTGITSKFVCPGDSVQLFKMSNFDTCNAVVYLYVHGDRITQIAKWTLKNCTLNSSLLPEYKNKVYFNTNGTILIHDVHPWDEGRYIMRKGDTVTMTYEEQIYVMELPTTECRPTILQLGNSLSVSLKHDVCGKPLATPYWKDCCGVYYSNESVLKFSPGKEACTCYACIVSPALKCARNSTSLDYCSTFIKGGTNTTPISLETMDVKMVVFVAVGIIFVISFLLVVIVCTILMRRRRRNTRWKCNTRREYADLEDDDPKERKKYKKLKQSDGKVRKRYKESNQSAEMQDLLRIQETQPSTVIESDDPKPMTENASSTMHGLSHNSKLIREKGPDTGYCTFCGQENNVMFILPCEHLGPWYMPTCIKCGISYKPCEKCKPSNTKYKEFEPWTKLADSARN